MRAAVPTTRLPIVAAPMAGGPTTVELAAAVAAAGGFPFLAGGYQSPAALGDQLAQLGGRDVLFGVNLFVPSHEPVDAAAFRAYAEEIAPEAAPYGLVLHPVPVIDDDGWDDKISLLIKYRAPVVSLTFGLPGRSEIAALQDSGASVLATVTSAEEAATAADAGVDGLVVQGTDAGGHSATFDPHRTPRPVATADLVKEVRAAADLPVVAGGGVDGPDAVRLILAAGAQAVAVGTMLLRTDEAGTSPTHRAALTDPAYSRTTITRAFTGRPARGLVNGFITRHDSGAPTAYPAVHHLTRPLRRAAAEAGDAERLHLWAGTGYRRAPSSPAGEVVRWLASRV